MNAKEARELSEFLLTGKEWLEWEAGRRSLLNLAPTPIDIYLKDPNSTWIDKRTSVEGGSVIYPGVSLRKTNTIGKDVFIDTGSFVEDAYLEDLVEIGKKNIIVRARIGKRTKVPYDAELVDIEIGPDTNIARGVTISNFDGMTKKLTKLGAGCFIGTNVNINGGVEMGDEVRVYPNLFVTAYWIPNHAWIRSCRCKNRKVPHAYDIEYNRSFKIPGHWRWIVTQKPVDSVRMHDFLRELGKEYAGRSKELTAFWKKEGPKLEAQFYLP